MLKLPNHCGRKTLLSDIRGNMTIFFAVSIFLIILAVGAAIDFSGMTSKKAKLQTYADMAVLAAASSGQEDIKALRKIARVSVSTNSGDRSLVTRLKIKKNGDLRVNVIGTYKPALMGMLGINGIQIRAISESPPVDGSGPMDIAIVIDVTDSMQGTKWDAMQNAVSGLVTDLQKAPAGTVRASLIPFARYIRLPMSYENSPWLEKQDSGRECWDVLDEANSVNCRIEGMAEAASTVCDEYVYREHCQFTVWAGCMASRVYPWNERQQYGGVKLQGFTLEDWCFDEIQPLTADLDLIKTRLGKLTWGEKTYIPAGLIWGWRSIMPSEPLSESNTSDKQDRKNVLVLMTDGENTASLGGATSDPSYPVYNGVYHWGNDVNAANALTSKLCSGIKNDGIEIFTIALEVTDTKTKSILQNCASDVDHYYNAAQASSLGAVFKDISKRLGAGIRLSK